MGTEVEPVLGNWYIDRDSGDQFQVLGFDEDEMTVQIQRVDADLDEIRLREWYAMNIDYSEAVLDPIVPVSDTDEGLDDYTAEDPHAAHLPSDRERYLRDYVDYAGKAVEGFPEPRPGREDEDKFERGSEMGLDRWPQSEERPRER